MKAPIATGLGFLVVACNAAPAASPPPPIASAAPPAPAVSAPPPPEANASSAPAAPAPAKLVSKSVALPGAKGPVSIDLVAMDRDHGRVWVPVGDTGSVDVFDIKSSAFKRIDGFKTKKHKWHGHEHMMGPSAATIGDGVAYVADRATGKVCAIDEKSLKRGRCVKLETPADFVTYVASTKEVWGTTPRDKSITVLDAKKPAALKVKTVIKALGSVEGSAVDGEHGLFFTNLEDRNQTLELDIKSHAVKARWSPGCSKAPHGVAVDPAHGFVIVGCNDGIRVLDASHGGAMLGRLDTGDGVDDIYYDASKELVYVAASRAKQLTVAHIGDKGQPSVVATGATTGRARNAVADASGNIYLPDSANAQLLVFAAPE